LLFSALHDPFYGLQQKALDLSYKMNTVDSLRLRSELMGLASADPNPKVRAKALKVLSTFGTKDEVKTAAQLSLNDSSYAVISNVLAVLANVDSNLALKSAFDFQLSENKRIQQQVLSIYSQYANADQLEWMKSMNNKTSGYRKAGYVWQFKKYILRLDETNVTSEGITHLKSIYFTSSHFRVKKECLYGLKDVEKMLKKKTPPKMDTEGEGTPVVDEKLAFQLEYLSELFTQIKATEKNENLLRVLED